MLQSDNDKSLKFASSLIKIIAVVIALMVIVMSKYAFIFFAAAMLPTIFTIFLDKNDHRCLSATICSFNLIGVMPYLSRVWHANSIDYLSKQLLADLLTWVVIYGAALAGQLLYAIMPLLIVRIYSLRMRSHAKKFEIQHKEICDQWGIDIK